MKKLLGAGGGKGEAGEVSSVPFSITAFWSCGDSLALLRVAVSPRQRFLLFPITRDVGALGDQ